MNIILVVVGIAAVLLSLPLLFRPSASARTEQRLSPEWLRGTIPQMWQGREQQRSRFAGAAFLAFGLALVVVGALMPSHPH